MNKIGSILWRLIDGILRFIVYKLLHLNISDEKWEQFLQFVKFGIVGVSNTVVNYVIYIMVLLLLQRQKIFPQTDYLLAQIAAFFLSVLWSFYWNRKYVFCAEGEKVIWYKALIKTYISYAFTGIFLNSVLSIIWVNVFHISKLLAPIANLLLSVPINFFMNKLWAFKSEK